MSLTYQRKTETGIIIKTQSSYLGSKGVDTVRLDYVNEACSETRGMRVVSSLNLEAKSPHSEGSLLLWDRRPIKAAYAADRFLV